MKMLRSALTAGAIAAAALTMAVGPSEGQTRFQVGTLACSISSGVGLVVGSQRNVNCTFKGAPGQPEENYTGTMTRVGVDIGITTGGAIIWAVFANTSRYAGMLTGTYVGATAEASVAAGLGANVLVGGSNHTVALQPVSVQGQLGLNIAAGVGQLELHPLR
jgi:Protein of unknown function (DUF992)